MLQLEMRFERKQKALRYLQSKGFEYDKISNLC